METDLNLDNVIRLAFGKPTLETGQVLVRVDPKTGNVVNNSLRLPFGRKPRQYIVSNADLPRRTAKGSSRVVPITLFIGDRDCEIGVMVDFQLQCPRGMETTVAQSLCGKDNPEEALLDVFDLAVQSYARDRQTELLSRFDDLRKEFAEAVQGFVKQATGLDTVARIRLKYEDNLDIVRLTDRKLWVNLQDVEGTHSVTLTAAIHPDPGRTLQAVISYPERHKLTESLIDRAQLYFAAAVAYHQFHEGLSDPEFRSGFESAVNEVLRNYGHVLGRWSIGTEVRGVRAKDFVRLARIDVERTPFEATEPVRIHNELQLILEDAGKFKASGESDIERWARDQLERVIDEVIFEMRYLDFLLRFDPVEKVVRERMQERARAIGYQLKHLISRPDMKEGEWFKPTTHRFTYDDGLPTGAANISVNLEVVTTFKLSRHGPAEQLLNTNVDLYSVIKASIRGQLEQLLHQMSPETIYMRFAALPEDGGPSLEMRLSGLVRKHLQSEYAAVVHEAPIIKPLNTEIGNFVEGLIGKSDDFHLSISPLGGDQTFDFYGKITVDSVDSDGWRLIKKRNFDIQQIRDQCVDALRTRLESVPYDEMLAYTTPDKQQEIEAFARSVVEKSVVEHYGVVVKLTNFRREKSEFEKHLSTVRIRRKRYKLEEASFLLDEEQERLEQKRKIAKVRREAQLEHVGILNEKEKRLLDDDDEQARDELATLDDTYRDRIGIKEKGGIERVDEILSESRKEREGQSNLPSLSSTLASTQALTRDDRDNGLPPSLPENSDGDKD